MRQITIIGDSNVVYLALTEDLLVNNYPLSGFFCQIIEPNDSTINFIGHIAKTAYSVDEDFLELQMSKLDIKYCGHIVFMYGTSDIDGGHLLRNNNHMHVLNRYMDICINFANSKNMTPVFIGPTFSGGNTKCFDIWNKGMHENSVKNNALYIEPFSCIDELDTYKWDKYQHFGKKASSQLFKSIKEACI